jgi:transcriptional regulator with XRE-family HTH domain
MRRNILSPQSIKLFREERGLSQQSLATMLNVGSKSVSRGERGETEPSGTTAAILSVLISGITRHEELGPAGPLASGYAIYRVLKSHFEEDEMQGD